MNGILTPHSKKAVPPGKEATGYTDRRLVVHYETGLKGSPRVMMKRCMV